MTQSQKRWSTVAPELIVFVACANLEKVAWKAPGGPGFCRSLPHGILLQPECVTPPRIAAMDAWIDGHHAARHAADRISRFRP
jgi:hypothetical protein